MQEPDGKLRVLNQDELKGVFEETNRKVVWEGQVFKIRQCYFQITEITPEGIKAKGISRKEYFDQKQL
jgi:hypothetical protein